jgi:hypothetical protein
MLTEFFMERAQIVLSADAERFIGTLPEFPELRVEATTPEACERQLREEMARVLMLEAHATPAHAAPADRPVIAGKSHSSSTQTSATQPSIRITVESGRACQTCGASGLSTAFQFCGLCGQRLS